MITNDAKEAADKIKEHIEFLLTKQDHVVLAVPGGRSVKTIFDALINANIPWPKVHLFMIDERLVPIDSEQSNFKLVDEQFIQRLNNQIPQQNIHPFVLEDSKDFGINTYKNALISAGGKYDIILLGVGEDGHVGALFPKYSIKDESDYFIILHNSPKPPKDRMTASKNLLLKSSLAVALFIGDGKKDAYKNFNDPEKSVNECPAKLVKKINNIILTG